MLAEVLASADVVQTPFAEAVLDIHRANLEVAQDPAGMRLAIRAAHLANMDADSWDSKLAVLVDFYHLQSQ